MKTFEGFVVPIDLTITQMLDVLYSTRCLRGGCPAFDSVERTCTREDCHPFRNRRAACIYATGNRTALSRYITACENRVDVKIKMHEGCDDLFPVYAKPDDACVDVRSRISVMFCVRSVVPTGIYCEIPPGYEIQIRPRSGLAAKQGITVLNTPGTIDAGYRGEIGVILYNTTDHPVEIKRGDRIAQMAVCKLPAVTFTKVDVLSETARGSGGFGSTGVQ